MTINPLKILTNDKQNGKMKKKKKTEEEEEWTKEKNVQTRVMVVFNEHFDILICWCRKKKFIGVRFHKHLQPATSTCSLAGVHVAFDASTTH